MLQDKFNRKKNNPLNGGTADSDIMDISGTAPDIDDILAEVDKAMAGAENLYNNLHNKIVRQQERDRDRGAGVCGC